MLTTNISKTINGTSTIDGSDVAWMNATISSDGAVNISKNISNSKLYKENLETVQNDMLEFENEVYAMQKDETVEVETTSEE